MSGSDISWAICKSAPRSRQITMPARHHSVFYRPDALPAAQPTASKHWRHKSVPVIEQIIDILLNFKQYVNCMGPGYKIDCDGKICMPDNFCWFCKLLCAFGAEMCGGIGQGMWLIEKVRKFGFGRTVGTMSGAIVQHLCIAEFAHDFLLHQQHCP